MGEMWLTAWSFGYGIRMLEKLLETMGEDSEKDAKTWKVR